MLIYVCLYIDIELNVCFGDYMHVIKLSIIYGKMYELNFPYGIHHLCDMTLTCNGASHCMCHPDPRGSIDYPSTRRIPMNVG